MQPVNSMLSSGRIIAFYSPYNLISFKQLYGSRPFDPTCLCIIYINLIFILPALPSNSTLPCEEGQFKVSNLLNLQVFVMQEETRPPRGNPQEDLTNSARPDPRWNLELRGPAVVCRLGLDSTLCSGCSAGPGTVPFKYDPEETEFGYFELKCQTSVTKKAA